MTVVSLSDDQYHDLGPSSIGPLFDKIHHLNPLSLEETRTLVDLRMNSVSNEHIPSRGRNSPLTCLCWWKSERDSSSMWVAISTLKISNKNSPAPFMQHSAPFPSPLPSSDEDPHSSSSRMGQGLSPRAPFPIHYCSSSIG